MNNFCNNSVASGPKEDTDFAKSSEKSLLIIFKNSISLSFVSRIFTKR